MNKLKALIGKVTLQAVIAFASLVTAFSALLTILEMRQSRIATMKPELVVESCMHEDTYRVEFTFGRTVSPRFAAVRLAAMSGAPAEKVERNLNIYNVGNAVALNVNVTASYAMGAIIARIEALQEEPIYEFDTTHGNLIVYKDGNVIAGLGSSGKARRGPHDLMPYSISSRPLPFVIPYDYFYLVSLLLHVEFKYKPSVEYFSKFGRNDTIHSLMPQLAEDGFIPELSAKLQYDDLAGNKYTKRFDIIPKFSGYRSSFSRDSCRVSVQFRYMRR